MSVYLELFHGRNTPDEELDDWGPNGPIFGPYDWVHITYTCHIKLGKNNGDDVDELCIVDDLVYYGGKFYGDFSVFSDDLIVPERPIRRFEPALKDRMEPFDKDKADFGDWRERNAALPVRPGK